MTSRVNHPFYLILRTILKHPIRWHFLIKGFELQGRENLPRKRKSCILICNHAAFVDSVYIICAVRPRFTICGAKPKYFSSFSKRFIFRLANVLKVENHDQFLNDCSTLLSSGENILIYPEMGRNPEGLGEFKSWAAEVAIAQQVPVVPCYLYGTTRGQFGAKQLIVGEPILPQEDVINFTKSLRSAVLNLNPDIEKGE